MKVIGRHYAHTRVNGGDVDSLLILGPKDEKLQRLLGRMGYDVRAGDESTPVADLLRAGALDLIVLDSSLDDGAQELCEYFCRDELTRDTPVLYLVRKPEHLEKIKDIASSKVEFIEGSFSAGTLVSRIATQLRLRKMAGSDENTASLAEINATLRDHNQRYQKEREEAISIQQSLLPESLPSDPAFEVAVSYDPLEEVGGDWYFVQREKSGKVSMLIADVTGHGLSAAFIGSMTKLALQATEYEAPKDRLSHMNKLMTPSLPPGRFVTMASVLYDPKSGAVDVTRAGHPPILIARKGKDAIEKVGGEGFAIGFMADSEYTEESATLEVGDALVLITDGVSEAQNRAGKMYGYERIIMSMNQAGGPAKQLVQAVLTDMDSFRDGRLLKDDVTIVILRRTA
jgi:sigma-B regulation protein RsbU (phosphoserine phosphatase)